MTRITQVQRPEGFPMFSSAVQRIATISLVAAPWEAGETMAERRAREAAIRAQAEESERRAAEYAANRKPGRNGYCLAPGCTVALSKHTRLGLCRAHSHAHGLCQCNQCQERQAAAKPAREVAR